MYGQEAGKLTNRGDGGGWRYGERRDVARVSLRRTADGGD